VLVTLPAAKTIDKPLPFEHGSVIGSNSPECNQLLRVYENMFVASMADLTGTNRLKKASRICSLSSLIRILPLRQTAAILGAPVCKTLSSRESPSI
jgi:hypothetical protein